MNAFFFRTCYKPIYWFPFYNATRKVLWQIDMLKSHGDITIPNQRCNMPVMSHLPFAHVLPAQRRVNQQVASRERSCSTYSRLWRFDWCIGWMVRHCPLKNDQQPQICHRWACFPSCRHATMQLAWRWRGGLGWYADAKGKEQHRLIGWKQSYMNRLIIACNEEGCILIQLLRRWPGKISKINHQNLDDCEVLYIYICIYINRV
jgi:hypothetical protein